MYGMRCAVTLPGLGLGLGADLERVHALACDRPCLRLSAGRARAQRALRNAVDQERQPRRRLRTSAAVRRECVATSAGQRRECRPADRPVLGGCLAVAAVSEW